MVYVQDVVVSNISNGAEQLAVRTTRIETLFHCPRRNICRVLWGTPWRVRVFSRVHSSIDILPSFRVVCGWAYAREKSAGRREYLYVVVHYTSGTTTCTSPASPLPPSTQVLDSLELCSGTVVLVDCGSAVGLQGIVE